MFATTAIRGLIPSEEKQFHRLPADGSFRGVMRVNMDELNFDWSDADLNGHVIVNHPARKVAVFSDPVGDVSVVTQEDGPLVVTSLSVDEAQRFMLLMASAIKEAEEIGRSVDATLDAAQAAGEI